MTDVTATEYSITPSTGYAFAYLTGDNAAQNDTLTCSGFRIIYASAGSLEPSSGDTEAETVEDAQHSGRGADLSLHAHHPCRGDLLHAADSCRSPIRGTV